MNELLELIKDGVMTWTFSYNPKVFHFPYMEI